MKNLLLMLITLLLLVSCENRDEKIAEANRIDNKLENFEKKLKVLISNDRLLDSNRDSLVKTLFNSAKKDKDFVGFYMNTVGYVYCTENMISWQIKGSGSKPFANKSLFKRMWIGDVYHGNSRPDPRRTSVGTDTYSNYQAVTKDVMYIHYEIQFMVCEIFLFYKLSKPYPDKYEEGTYSTAGTSFPKDEFVVLK
jgi:hypothetical protein